MWAYYFFWTSAAFSKAEEQTCWLDHVKETVNNTTDDCQQDMEVSSSVFYAGAEKISQSKAICPLLPLFKDDSKSLPMIRHSMQVIKDAVNFINPGQVPVITCDQPLFAVTKLIQWNFPAHYGEDKFVLLFGGLHVEMAALKTVGQWLEESGWSAVIIESNFAATGCADALLKASYVSRTRNAHQVTACALYILMSAAYNTYIKQFPEDQVPCPFHQWKANCISQRPQFQY